MEWLVHSFYGNLRGGRKEESVLFANILILDLRALCLSGTAGILYQMRMKDFFSLLFLFFY